MTFHSLPEGLSLVASLHRTGLLAAGATNLCHRNPVRARSSAPPEVTLNGHLLANGKVLPKAQQCRVPRIPEAVITHMATQCPEPFRADTW